MSQLAAAPDPERPGFYVVGLVLCHFPDGSVKILHVLWRDLREQDPEAFVHLARATFADWCARNGW